MTVLTVAPAALLPAYLPANIPGKAADDTRVPEPVSPACDTWTESPALGASTAQVVVICAVKH